jgi:hypothetical protein
VEQHLRFDGDTGLELEQSLAMRAKVEGDEVIREAAAFVQMKSLPGYQYLEKFLNNVIDAYKDKLMETDNFKEFRRLQEHARAYANVLTYVDAVIAQGDQIRTEHEDLQTDPVMDPPSESPDADNPT